MLFVVESPGPTVGVVASDSEVARSVSLHGAAVARHKSRGPLRPVAVAAV